jgi:predicted Abi (CAAX) family protease
MALLHLHWGGIGQKVRGLPHRIRESWPLNRVPRTRDWELLVITFLVIMALAMAIAFAFGEMSHAP